MPWGKKSCGQVSVIYPLTNHYWMLINKLRDAGNGFHAPASTVTKTLLEERLRLYEAGWSPHDSAMENILSSALRLSPKNRMKVFELIKKLSSEGKNANSKAAE